ncbi:MAG: molybdopterin-binding protein [Paracoccaceae bacterium]|nr:molybdopterin-binding protein [Paracoccaceae bacterium]
MTAHDHLAPMLDIAAARALATSLLDPIVETEELLLPAALGRFCAQTVVAPLALPRRARSAMDGFALRLSELTEGQALPIAGTIAAGAEAPALPPGACLRIFTGALVPAGADAVLPVEECTETGAMVHLSRRPEPGENIRAPGAEQPEGGVLLCAHARVAPHHIGLLAANGITRLRVLRRPRVGVFSSGDELDAQSPDHLPDSNRPMLLALAAAAGAEVTDLGLLPDELPAITARLAALNGQDLILTSGAVSMGGARSSALRRCRRRRPDRGLARGDQTRQADPVRPAWIRRLHRPAGQSIFSLHRLSPLRCGPACDPDGTDAAGAFRARGAGRVRLEPQTWPRRGLPGAPQP